MVKLTDTSSRKRALYDLFRDARDKARICRVISFLHEYEDMVIESVTVTRSPESKNGADFVVVLKQIQFVTSEVVSAPEPAEVSGQIKKSAGSKNAEQDDEKSDEVKKSLLAKIVDSGADLLGGF
jgi:hypothetical protein